MRLTKIIIGSTLLASPFLVIFGLVVWERGWPALAMLLGFLAAIIAPIIIGLRILNKAR